MNFLWNVDMMKLITVIVDNLTLLIFLASFNYIVVIMILLKVIGVVMISWIVIVTELEINVTGKLVDTHKTHAPKQILNPKKNPSARLCWPKPNKLTSERLATISRTWVCVLWQLWWFGLVAPPQTILPTQFGWTHRNNTNFQLEPILFKG